MVVNLIRNEDLVELMLMVATGNKLPQRLIDKPFIKANGWSIESRVYAEDPLRSFLPSIGPLLTYKEPVTIKEEDKVPFIYIYLCVCTFSHMYTYVYVLMIGGKSGQWYI